MKTWARALATALAMAAGGAAAQDWPDRMSRLLSYDFARQAEARWRPGTAAAL